MVMAETVAAKPAPDDAASCEGATSDKSPPADTASEAAAPDKTEKKPKRSRRSPRRKAPAKKAAAKPAAPGAGAAVTNVFNKSKLHNLV